MSEAAADDIANSSAVQKLDRPVAGLLTRSTPLTVIAVQLFSDVNAGYLLMEIASR